MTDPIKEYQEQQERYREAWSFLIPRFLPEYKWYQQLSAGTGWCELIKKLVADLDDIWEGWEGNKGSGCWGLMQCKEKFGALRFYAHSTVDGDEGNPAYKSKTEEFQRILSEYGKKSLTICETCGKAGQFRTVGGWAATACQDDYDIWLAKRNAEEQKHPEHATPIEDLMDEIERLRRKESK